MSEQNTYQFNAEVGKVLQLMIHSLYTNKDIFIRELISNASDAIDKLRYLSVTSPNLSADDVDYKICIKIDETASTLTVSDNGIGMDREDLINNLGTIAKSGTQSFLEQLSGDQKKDANLIGQFGVGFYSSFMVADEVVVLTRKGGSNQAYKWSSQGIGEFSIEEATNEVKRGTSIIVKLREECKEYLDRFKVKHIVTTYSDHISFPIVLIDTDGKEEVVNSASALWTKSKNEITEEQYKQFYHSVAHAFDDPWMTLHNKNEGTLEFTNLLFIPSKKPFDLYHPDRKSKIKLYVKKVFISEDINLIPAYMRFIRGVVDSEDLPLNISRETLQHSAMIDKIKRSLTKKVLAELKKKTDNDKASYGEFWANFGPVLKEGLCEGGEFRDDILAACKFASSERSELISLEEYIANMKEGQQYMYYLVGDDLERLKKSPQLEGFKAQNIEVILLADHVDSFWVNVVNDYKEKEFKSITRENIDLNKSNEDSQENTKDLLKEEGYSKLIELIKQELGERVKEVKLSKKLTNSPVCITVPEGGMDIKMERFLIEQKQLVMAAPKIFEINPDHPIVAKLANKADFNEDDKMVVRLLYNQACIVEGEMIQDVNEFAAAINSILLKAQI
ncbi:molecular chaperone HtpG [Rickettsiales endosymbiont of Stachyamoeba lipophora]|uniref:molecular chaperone HtpG n=1 Tax=Rickettsiales endosymbiont of Stachyamoeba lipophora TaxID=2486578 RepID=UPI000F64C0F3|nr:molecular chaperone HtpG [Rickettsiales endosymbiont of Stachyamoeba lipophora]AZL15306.1 molecular chaperone HtpG [Rickettsiales endosymbiont of Stachyamoeba lipophora]